MDVNWDGILPIQGEIIVIEDDPTLRSLMVDIVAEIGAKAVAFDTADDALTYLLEAHDQCRLVIADYGVPGQIQGIEFIEFRLAHKGRDLGPTSRYVARTSP